MPSLATQIPTFIRVSTKLARFVGLTLRPLAWIAAPCATLLVVAFILHECLAAHRWSAYRKEAANRGIALDLPKDPSPPIPDGENFAGAGSPFAPHTFADANRWLGDMRDIHFRGPSIGRGERMTTEKAYAMESTPVRHVRNVSDSSPVSPDTFQPHTAEDFLAVCERNFGAQWPTILEAEARSKTRFAPVASPLPQPNSFGAMVARKTVQLHSMRAMAYLDLGRHEEALAEVRGSFQLAGAIHAGGGTNVIGYMMETAIALAGVPSIWEGLVDRRWTDSDLLTLQAELATLHPAEDWPLMVAAERAWENAVYDQLAADSPRKRYLSFENLFDKPRTKGETVALALAAAASTSGVVRDSQYVTNLHWDAARQWFSADGCWHPEIRPAKLDFDTMDGAQKYRYLLAYRFTPNLSRAACRVAATEACLREASLAVALERYRRQHHDLPVHLEALVPEFIAALPEDPINGAPIQYARQSAESFRLTCPDRQAGDVRISDVWDGVERNGKNSGDVIWYGLPPESNISEAMKTAGAPAPAPQGGSL